MLLLCPPRLALLGADEAASRVVPSGADGILEKKRTEGEKGVGGGAPAAEKSTLSRGGAVGAAGCVASAVAVRPSGAADGSESCDAQRCRAASALPHARRMSILGSATFQLVTKENRERKGRRREKEEGLGHMPNAYDLSRKKHNACVRCVRIAFH